MADPNLVTVSLLVGALAVLVIVTLLYSVGRTWEEKYGKNSGILAALIREEDKFPSLARFQLLIWTLVIVFAFLSISFVRLFSGVFSYAYIPTNVLTLIGINAGSTVISYGISNAKYLSQLGSQSPEPQTQPDPANNAAAMPPLSQSAGQLGSQSPEPQTQPNPANTTAAASPLTPAGDHATRHETHTTTPSHHSRKLPTVSSMLDENGVFSMTRFQMLAWTFIGILIFLATFFAAISSLPVDMGTLDLTDVSPTLVTLAGISQGVYLAGKGISQ